MNNKKIMSSVFEKISNGKEVNLESQKVELGLIDDIKTDYKDFIKFSEGLGEFTREILNARGGLSKGISKSESKIKTLNKKIEQYKSKLKDLGIDEEPVFIRTIINKVGENIRMVRRFEKDFL